MKALSEAAAVPVNRSGLRLALVQGGLPLGAILGALAVVGGVAVRWLHLDRLGITLCTFKAATGLPCMTCGGTRTLALLARGDLPGALAMNPLVAVAFFVLVPWALADLALWTRGQALGLDLGPAARRWILIVGGIALVVNWAYLMVMGR
jgi:hypothetical protein